ncbi:uncharacterized protein QC764_0103250 [Podospora pseudoanserina]|uniref:Uncharacterized protein n=1 Tax=Podospora pseudoanserina TaxID=2609844 RepID=A0ABR0HL13_9PEZI|nr:hypothetical protein QC764_0103250 [Podospora pseudoanserina]
MCAICDPSKQASASTHLVTHSNLSLFAPGVLLLGSFPGEACDPLPFGVYAERQDDAVKAAGPPSAGHVRPDCRAVVRFHSRKAPDVRHRTRIFPSLLPGAGLGHYQQADICQHAESAGISQPHHPVAVLTFSSL